jgi:nitrate reductase alpha subunit
MEPRTAGRRQETELTLSLLDSRDRSPSWASPTLAATKTRIFAAKQQPVRFIGSGQTLTLASGESGLVVSVYDLILANYGLDRGLDDENAAGISAR